MRSFRERSPRVVGVISIVLIAAGMAAAFAVPKLERLRGVYTIYADLQDAAGLRPDNEVRLAGVKVGRVSDIELRPGAARIAMEIQEAIRLPLETEVEVKLKTLLGQKFVDLQFPRMYLLAASQDGDPSRATTRYLLDGEVIPKSQTHVPYDIYQAASEGTETLEKIDKRQLRRLLNVLAGTAGAAGDELGRALVSLDRASHILASEGADISVLLRNAEDVSKTLAESDRDIAAVLDRGAVSLRVLAERRRTLSSLLAATDELTATLAVVIQQTRGSIEVGANDLSDILIMAQAEIDTIEAVLRELPTAQELFATPTKFGRFLEGHTCAVTTEDTCVPEGTPADPGIPASGRQPGGEDVPTDGTGR